MPRRFPRSPFRKGDTAMMKDVWISISNLQNEGREKDGSTMVFDTAGYYFFDDGVGVLSYQESELTGLEGTRTSVMVMPNQVVVDRDGMLTGRMVFREGQRDSYPYSTPYGQMLLDTLPFLQAAQGLYRSLGFREIGRYNDSPMDTSIYMRLTL